MRRARRLVAAAAGALVLLSATPAVEGVAASRRTCGGETATIVGTRRADRLEGTRGRDVVVGLGGRDVVVARGGEDLVCGGGGPDMIFGGRGADRLLGQGGNDALLGGGGRDLLDGGRGADGCLQGGAGGKRRCSVVVGAAGDIACDPESSSFGDGSGTEDRCHMRATSDLLIRSGAVRVLTLGDNQYEEGTLAQFRASYRASWGRLLSVTRPSVGNHEYRTEDAAGYFSFFGRRAGRPTRGYYSYDLDDWHLVALNSNCAEVGGCHQGTPQYRWLARDLERIGKRCVLAYWHHPKLSSVREDATATNPLWRLLYRARAELVLTGHDHVYERFAPVRPDGEVDPERGIPQFTVGTGGKSLYAFIEEDPRSVMRQNTAYGILRLNLRRNAYRWSFRAEPGASFSDTGRRACG